MQQAAKLRPGIVCVSICAYSHEGPWASRRGFDSLVQNANGLNDAEAQAFGARVVDVQEFVAVHVDRLRPTRHLGRVIIQDP